MNGGDIVVKLELDDNGYRIATVNAGRLMKELKQTFESTATSVKRLEQHQDSLGRKFRDLVLTLGNLRFVAMDIHDVFLRLPMAMLKTAGELEKMQQLMTGLSTQTEKAKAQLEGLRDFNFVVNLSKNAPFEIAALSDAFVKLKTAGLDPANGTLQTLVDSVARFGGTSEQLKRASVAIQQMYGKGVISMEELRQQLGEAVPTAMKAMADGMGLTMAELTEKVSKGIVTAGPALEKMFLRLKIENEGAAADMMLTWVGMTSRLKTEWDLMSKHVVDSGLGAAAKQVVGDLTSALTSDELRGFGKEFGQDLGEIVKGGADVARTLFALREEIGFLVKAWLAYKVVTSVIAPLGREIARTNGRIVAAIQQETNAVRNAVAERQRSAAQTITLARQEEAATRQRTTNVIQARMLETAILRQENERVLADHNRLQMALSAAEARRRGGVNIPGIQGAQSKDAVRAQMQDLRMVMDANSAAIRANANEIRAHQAAMAAASSATATAVANAANMTQGMNAKAAATHAASLAARGFSSVVNFLGGPIGALITTLGMLAAAYAYVANKADEAAAAQKRAQARQSVEGDDKRIKSLLDEAAKERGAAERWMKTQTIIDNRTGRPRQKTADERAADLANYQEKLAKERQLQQDHQRSITTIQENESSRRAKNAANDLERELRMMGDAHAEKVRVTREQVAEWRKANPDAKGKDGAIAPELDKLLKNQADVVIAGLDQKIALVQSKTKQLADAQKGLANPSEAERKTYLETARMYGETYDALIAERDRLVNARNSGNVFNVADKKTKGKQDKDSPLQREIENLRESIRSGQAELKGFDSTLGEADKVAAAVERVRERIANGDFGPKLTREEKTQLINMVVENATIKKQIKDKEEEVKEAEKLAREMEQVRAFIANVTDDYNAAMEQMLDPMGTNKRNAGRKKVDDWLNREENMRRIKELAKKEGTSEDSIISSLYNKAEMAETLTAFAEMARQTKQIEDGLVEDSREAARARAAAENERFRQMQQNIINEKRLRGVSDEEISRLQDALSRNSSARAKRLEKEFEHPINKIAANWANATRNMEEASAGWANSTMDFMVELVTKGKADFRSLVTSILADLARIQLQKAASPFVGAAGSFFTSFVTGLFGGAPAASLGSNYSIAPSPSGGLGLKSGLSAFANGGIMTEFGSAPLRKYAAGGIAKSPQLALFGEGSMPEAYVPLPDGRTIPVTIAGAGASNTVAINIVVNNQSGTTQTQTSGSGGNEDAYKRMGERVKQVVREELANQARPGGMLYR